jgi:hypothetical protein
MAFQLVYVGARLEPMPVYGVATFDDGNEASAFCRTVSLPPDIAARGYTKVQPRPIRASDDDSWMDREAARFATGEYQRTVWHDESWFHDNPATRFHFCHLSKKRPGCVTYTADADKGRADLQAPPMRPGRYLESFHSGVLTEAQRRYWTQRFLAAHGGAGDAVHITQDADAIEYAYTHGPHSCMAHSASQFSSECHPSRAYAGPDLGVAFIVSDRDSTDLTADVESWDFTVAARCVVWPERKWYGRVYGDGGARSARLEELLQEQGYRREGDFDGARMRLIEDGAIVCPYLDVGSRVTVRGQYLVIDPSGEFEADSTDGVLADASRCCDHCDDRMDEESSVYIEDRSEIWCESCAQSDGFSCEGTGNWFSHDVESITLANGAVWSQDHADSCGVFFCEACDAYQLGSDYAGSSEHGEAL